MDPNCFRFRMSDPENGTNIFTVALDIFIEETQSNRAKISHKREVPSTDKPERGASGCCINFSVPHFSCFRHADLIS